MASKENRTNTLLARFMDHSEKIKLLESAIAGEVVIQFIYAGKRNEVNPQFISTNNGIYFLEGIDLLGDDHEMPGRIIPYPIDKIEQLVVTREPFRSVD